MATPRDTQRTANATIFARAKELGISVDDLRKETRDESRLGDMIQTLINSSTPRVTRKVLTLELPPEGNPAGAFDGVNTDFNIVGPVEGSNIIVLHCTQSTGALVELFRTTSPTPAAGTFYFDDVTLVRVGTPPEASDGLAVLYNRKVN